jgi:hypothetical protein
MHHEDYIKCRAPTYLLYLQQSENFLQQFNRRVLEKVDVNISKIIVSRYMVNNCNLGEA